MESQLLHHDSLDLLVAATMVRGAGLELAVAAEDVLESADLLGQLLSDQNAAAAAEAERDIARPEEAYRWRPVVELLAGIPDDELTVQLERTRVAYIEKCCRHSDWATSPARHCMDELGIAIRERLNRGTMDPQRMILTTDEWRSTDPDWRRPTSYTHENLSDSGTA